MKWTNIQMDQKAFSLTTFHFVPFQQQNIYDHQKEHVDNSMFWEALN